MADKTKIEWTQGPDGKPGATWNPVTGCTKVSPGCDHCYAETFAERWRGTPGHHFENGFDVTLRPERLEQPQRWRRGRRIFVNSMSDLFHDTVPDEFIARVWQVMATCPQHQFLILTKRHARMRAWVNRCQASPAGWITHDGTDPAGAFDGSGIIVGYPHPPERPAWWGTGSRGGKPRHKPQPVAFGWPLPNVWLGVSVEDQKWAGIRIPALLETPAAVRFLSCEPLLGPLDVERFLWDGDRDRPGGIHWVIAGGESGHHARPMHPAWARSLQRQCADAGVPFFFKQWGEFAPEDHGHDRGGLYLLGERGGPGWNRTPLLAPPGSVMMRRVGKKAAGRELDGRTWDEFPGEPAPAVA